MTDYTTLPDNELADLYLDGDQQAFCVLYRRHQGRLRSVALGIVRDQQAADCCASQAWSYLAKSMGEWRRECSFSTWAHSTVRCRALNWLRHKRRRLAEMSLDDMTAEDCAAWEVPDWRDCPERIVDAAENMDIVLGAIAKLPPVRRQMLTMHVIDGHDYETIRTLTGTRSLGTVKSTIFRARAALADLVRNAITPPLEPPMT